MYKSAILIFFTLQIFGCSSFNTANNSSKTIDRKLANVSEEPVSLVSSLSISSYSVTGSYIENLYRAGSAYANKVHVLYRDVLILSDFEKSKILTDLKKETPLLPSQLSEGVADGVLYGYKISADDAQCINDTVAASAKAYEELNAIENKYFIKIHYNFNVNVESPTNIELSYAQVEFAAADTEFKLDDYKLRYGQDTVYHNDNRLYDLANCGSRVSELFNKKISKISRFMSKKQIEKTKREEKLRMHEGELEAKRLYQKQQSEEAKKILDPNNI